MNHKEIVLKHFHKAFPQGTTDPEDIYQFLMVHPHLSRDWICEILDIDYKQLQRYCERRSAFRHKKMNNATTSTRGNLPVV